MFAFRITEDRVERGKWVGFEINSHGNSFEFTEKFYKSSSPLVVGKKSSFELYDDDNILYFKGEIIGDFIGFEPLDHWSFSAFGCTQIRIDGEWL